MTPTYIAEHFDRIPPKLCLLSAARRGNIETLRAVSARSGIPLRTLCRIVQRNTWSGVKSSTIAAISAACGVNLIHQGPAIKKLKAMLVSAQVPLAGLTRNARDISYFSRSRRRQGVLLSLRPKG